MALKVRHNRAEHTHENVQFRRVVSGIKALFDQKGWDGLLIGNPENEDFTRFRADAILLYNHGLIIIDFKDYRGSIDLPRSDRDFMTAKWYNETEDDKQRIMIKAGSQFINPFAQLNSYRGVMKEIISSSVTLNKGIDGSRICCINIFSGPVEINRETPRSIPYYKIVQESDFHNFLYDYSSVNSYSDEIANALISIFPAEVWEENLVVKLSTSDEKKVLEIDGNTQDELKNFLKDKNSGLLILESMCIEQRDNWMRYVLGEATNYGIPQTEVWTHSTRIAHKIQSRTGLSCHSLYKTIYGGGSRGLKEEEKDVSSDTEESNDLDNLQEIVSLKPDDEIDAAAIIILHEAHLVTNSLHQTELLKFGSGRLLEDLLKFLKLESTCRKVICIGDPYSFSFGREDESAISLKTVKELFGGNVNSYRSIPHIMSAEGKDSLRYKIANSIENDLFNSLRYPWQEGDLVKVEKPEIEQVLREWYSTPFNSEPLKTILVYSNAEAHKLNLWVKRNCLKNSDGLAINDLLLVNNNINIPDSTGFGRPTKIINGMYLSVIEKKEELEMPIAIRQSKRPVILCFTKLRVKCLGLPNILETDVWIFNNYFENTNELSEHEQIAFRVLINQKIQDEQKKYPFEDSKEYFQFQQDSEYIVLAKEEQEINNHLSRGDRVKTKLEEKQRQIRKVQRKYKQIFKQKILSDIINTDPIINAVRACYGWAITVHKSVGTTFDQILLKASQGDARGVSNESYFRWLYSALTTSKSTAFIANPVEINPLVNCQFEDSCQKDIEKTNPNKKVALYFDFNESSNYITEKLDNSLNDNVKGCICGISKLLGPTGYLLEGTIKKDDFLSKATYSIPDATEQKLVIAVNNNKSGLITSIRIERAGGANESIVRQCIAAVEAKADQNIQTESAKWPADFRKSVYELWKEKCYSEGFDLKLFESHSYQDVFILLQNNGSNVRFRVHYNGKGFFTKISVIEKSNDNLISKLRSLLLNGE